MSREACNGGKRTPVSSAYRPCVVKGSGNKLTYTCLVTYTETHATGSSCPSLNDLQVDPCVLSLSSLPDFLWVWFRVVTPGDMSVCQLSSVLLKMTLSLSLHVSDVTLV